MTKTAPMRNIRIADDIWFKAKEDALHNRMTLQDYLVLLILKGKPDSKVEVKPE